MPAHTVVELALILMLGVSTGETEMVTLLDVAVVCVTQLAFEVNTQLTTAPFAKVVELNVAALVPVLTPFTFHWYVGLLPPLVAVAVKFTFAPAHTLVEVVLILIVGVALDPTVMVVPI